MEHTVSDVNRRLDELARMKPGESGDVECWRPIPEPVLALARRFASVYARLAGRVDFAVWPIATGGLQFQWDGCEMDIHADGTVLYPAPGGERLLDASGRPCRLTLIAVALREAAAGTEPDDGGRA